MHSSQLPIPAPCPASWENMSGDDRRRFCSECKLHVHDLSAMTAVEAETLVDSEPDICVQYTVERATGEILHQRTRRRGLLGVAAGALLAAATPALAAGSLATERPQDPPSLVERIASWWSSKPMATAPDGEAPLIPELDAVSPLPAVAPVKPEPEVKLLGKPVPPVVRGQIRRPTTR